MPNIVPIEQHRGPTKMLELPVDFVRDRALAAAAKTGEPDDNAALPEPPLTLDPGDTRFMPYDR